MKKKIVRILALVLALLLAGGALVSAFIYAIAEETPRDAYELTIELYEDEQALHVSQRLVYTNRSGAPLDRVMFSLPANMFRRESALVYAARDLDAVFPAGYAPGGVEIGEIRVGGEPADWGVQGDDELYLRVACALQPGESCEFFFDYHVLLTRCNAFLGVGDTDWRLSGFYPLAAACVQGDFILNAPLAFARTQTAPMADYTVRITLPENYDLACPGAWITENNDGAVTWTVNASAHEFAFSFSRRWRAYSGKTSSGVEVRVLANARGGARRALKCALETVEQYEEWFGPFPQPSLTLAQSDYPLDALAFDGLIWISSDALSGSADELEMQLRTRIAQQYFGMKAWVNPVADAWMTDALSTYAAYLALEAARGESAYLRALNQNIVPSLQLTMPGGLNVTSAASLFTENEYRIIVLDRGVAVLHELRSAMGRETLIDALRLFVDMGKPDALLGEYDLVAALDRASGGSWEDFLTDWLFNIDIYTQQNIDWLE